MKTLQKWRLGWGQQVILFIWLRKRKQEMYPAPETAVNYLAGLPVTELQLTVDKF